MVAQLRTDSLVGTVLIDRFEILSRIGEGSSGIVYKAKQIAVDRIVALKVLDTRASADPTWVKRFHNEAKAVARLDHPNTVRLIDFGETKEGLLFIAMEFLHGRTLDEEIVRRGKLSPQRTLRIISQVCQSLAEAHGQGIIHRDIKPDNIFLVDTMGGGDFVKVLDFSVAKLDTPDAQQTRAGTVFGTPAYMSPEQARGAKLTPHSDIYACGIVMYEMLTGKPPFEAALPMEVVMMHLRQKPAPLKGLPEPVTRLVMKALEKTPERRQQSADELSRACLLGLEEISSEENAVKVKTAAVPSTDPLVGRILMDRFEILSRVSEGSTGVVYRAKQLTVDRIIAIKVLGSHVSSDPTWVKRFHNEARAAARLDHPNTVRLIDYGETKEGLLFIAMEFLHGRALADELDRGGKLSPQRTLRIISQVCQSLAEAHGQGIIHRDIKPDNIFLVDTMGGGDFVKVLDFSVAKLDTPDAQQTRAGTVFGTPAYMSPEQARGAKLTPHSDIYACGIVMYEMLTGKPPFEAALPMEVVMMHLRQKPAPLKGLPEPVTRLVMKALEKTPERRQQSADELYQDCQKCLADLVSEGGETKLAMRMAPPPGSPQGPPPGPPPPLAPPPSSTLKTVLATEVPPAIARLAGRDMSATVIAEPPAIARLAGRNMPAPGISSVTPQPRHPEPTRMLPVPEHPPLPTSSALSLPKGFTQRHELPCRGYVHAWSPDGKLLAVGCSDKTVRIWDTATGQMRHTLRGHTGGVIGVSWIGSNTSFCSIARDQMLCIWDLMQGTLLRTIRRPSPILSVTGSPTSTLVAIGSLDGMISVLDFRADDRQRVFKNHRGGVSGLAFSPDGKRIASASFDGTLALWDTDSSQLQMQLRGHDEEVLGLAWSPDGQVLASVSRDRTVRLWDPSTGATISVIEGHTATVNSVCFSHDGSLLASQSRDDTLRLWNRRSLQQLCVIRQPRSFFDGTLSFHPRANVLATTSENRGSVRLWELDRQGFSSSVEGTEAVYYTNAKVVLIGETGVGKSGLGMVLAGERYDKTDSSHARKVWVMNRAEVVTPAGERRIQEILLWDLAGQAGYRQIHQLSMKEVTIALMVIDTRSETDPFAGVQYWDRALRQAQRSLKEGHHLTKRFLVVARTDRGSLAADQARIQEVVREYGFAGYFKTSALKGDGIEDLRRAIFASIDWDALLIRSSNVLFHRIKEFLDCERDSGQILAKEDQLYRAFLRTPEAPPATPELRAQFHTCINLVERRGLIRQLSFGDLVLLKPELLDSYAWALLNAAKDEPDGLGYISENAALAGQFGLPDNERVTDRQQEEILLLAVIRDLVVHEIALREETGADCQLVFPSQLTRRRSDLPDPPGKELTFSFEGALATIYATLAVRLSRSEIFRRKDMWHNAVTYRSELGGVCGMFLQDSGEGQGKLTLFLEGASLETLSTFEAFVYNHLRRYVEEERIRRHRTFRCGGCKQMISEETIALLKANGKGTYRCPICDATTSVTDRVATRTVSVQAMNTSADNRRDKAAAELDVRGKLESGVFDIWFRCEPAVEVTLRSVNQRLREQGILAWSEQATRPASEKGRGPQIKSIIVCLGPDGRQEWEGRNFHGEIDMLARRNVPIGILLLPGAPDATVVPPQFRSFVVDIRIDEDVALNQLMDTLRELRPQGFIPTRPSLRELLQKVLATDSEFTAFCSDYFPKTHMQCTGTMDRLAKASLLLDREDPAEILPALRRYDQDRYLRHENLLRFDEGLPTGL